MVSKSRVQWLKCGDMNKKIVHTSTLIRWRHNRIESPQDENDWWMNGSEELVNMALRFLEGLYKSDPNSGGPILAGFFPRLNPEVMRDLNKDYMEKEIYIALWQMGL